MARTLGRSTVKFVPLKAELGRSADWKFSDNNTRDVPYVPTPERVVAKMLELADVNERDIVYDLGCGDGRIVIAAAKERGARGVGIDIDPERIKSCASNAFKAEVSDRVRFEQKSVFRAEIADATVVALYLLPWMNAQLRPKLLAELLPGTRIVAHQFEIADWPADRIVRLEGSDRVVYLWIVPAKVNGRWNCTVRTTDGALRRGIITWEQEFQTILGHAILDQREWPIEAAKLTGNHVTFQLGGAIYNARVDGESMRGAGDRIGQQTRHASGRRGQLEIRARRI